MNAFHVVGALLAIWAVSVAFFGITRGFPNGRRQATLAGSVSVLLATGAIGSAIAVGALEKNKHEKKAAPAGGGAAAGNKLQLAADPSGALKFDKTSLQAKAGTVTIDMKNPAPIKHDISIQGNGVKQIGKQVSGGGTSTVTTSLKSGTYTFYCSVDAHRQAGMQGKLTVSG